MLGLIMLITAYTYLNELKKIDRSEVLSFLNMEICFQLEMKIFCFFPPFVKFEFLLERSKAVFGNTQKIYEN